MKANELRIGNWINDNGYNSIIGVIDSHYHAIQISGSPRMIALETIEPIPLTDEWVLRFGFKKDSMVNITFFLKGFGYITIPKNGNCIFRKEGIEVIIKYVHQLQNLYFALTGEELTIS